MAAFRWARDTLAQHIQGGLNADQNAGGTVPDRLNNLVNLAYYTIWEGHDWLFKDFRAELDFAAGVDIDPLPADFDKISMKWVQENNRRGRIRFTEDAQFFEGNRDLPNERNGVPYLARIEPATGSTFLWQVRILPPPTTAVNYPYIYVKNAPDLAADTTFPVWPDKFDRGWELLATAQAARMFIRDKSWKALMGMYDEWLQRAIEQQDETMVSSTPVFQDTQGDVAGLPSSGYVRNVNYRLSNGP
jgi:hypothetical protein